MQPPVYQEVYACHRKTNDEQTRHRRKAEIVIQPWIPRFEIVGTMLVFADTGRVSDHEFGTCGTAFDHV